jgi:excisionase family DNA binding protein
MQSKPKAFYSTTEAAEVLGVSVSTVQGLVEAGVLHAWKTKGGHRRIPSESLLNIQNQVYPNRINLPQERSDKDATEGECELKHQNKAALDIMIIEDDPFMVSIYEGALAEYSRFCSLRTCSDGVDALIQLGKQPPDFVILDLDIPNVNGIEMLRYIQKHNQNKATQVLVITGLDDKELALHQELLARYTVVQKPVSHQFVHGYLSCLFALRKALA